MTIDFLRESLGPKGTLYIRRLRDDKFCYAVLLSVWQDSYFTDQFNVAFLGAIGIMSWCFTKRSIPDELGPDSGFRYYYERCEQLKPTDDIL